MSGEDAWTLLAGRRAARRVHSADRLCAAAGPPRSAGPPGGRCRQCGRDGRAGLAASASHVRQSPDRDAPGDGDVATPAARTADATELLRRLLDENQTGRTSIHTYPDGTIVRLGNRPVFVIFTGDVDPLEGEDVVSTAQAAADRLQVAFDEAIESQSPRRLVRAGAISFAATLLYALGIWAIVTAERRGATSVTRRAEQRLRRLSGGDALVDVTGARTSVHRLFTAASWGLAAVLTYGWMTIVMRRFPYTRPWGESLRSGLFSTVGSAVRAVIGALSDVATVLAIVVVIRLLTQLVAKVFAAVEQERLTLPGVYPDTAASTRRIMVTLLWLCALIVWYPYLPGSRSEVFKGISVFVGLLVSFGSSGVMNQAMSGLMVTYSRSLKCGSMSGWARSKGPSDRSAPWPPRLLRPSMRRSPFRTRSSPHRRRPTSPGTPSTAPTARPQ